MRKWNIITVYSFSPGVKEQTVPPTIPVAELFPSGDFPEGEIMEYPKLADE